MVDAVEDAVGPDVDLVSAFELATERFSKEKIDRQEENLIIYFVFYSLG